MNHTRARSTSPDRSTPNPPPPRSGGASDPETGEGWTGTVDGKNFRVVVADETQLRDESVLGHNHVRRRPDEIEAERAHRRVRPPRWRRTWHYRLRNSARVRLLCILLPSLMAAGTALGLFWHLEEEIAGIAVAAVVLLGGISAFISTEIMIRCPNLTKGLLRDLGIIHRVPSSSLPPMCTTMRRRGGAYHGSDDEDADGNLVDDYVTADEYASMLERGKLPSELIGEFDVDDNRDLYAHNTPYAAQYKPIHGDVARESRKTSEKLWRAGERVIETIGRADNPINMMLRGNPFSDPRDGGGGGDGGDEVYPETDGDYEAELAALGDNDRRAALEMMYSDERGEYYSGDDDGNDPPYRAEFYSDDGGGRGGGGGDETGYYAEGDGEAEDAEAVADPQTDRTLMPSHPDSEEDRHND